MRKRTIAVIAIAMIAAACGADDGSEHDVTLIPTDVENGAAPWPLQVEMRTGETLTIEPAGDIHEDAGHFHVMVDAGCVEPGEPIPSDATHRHFGDGSLATTIPEIEPGTHDLCLQVGDGAHTALDATHEITVEVGDVTETAWSSAVNRQCRAVQEELDPYFEEFFATWEAELEAGAGPDHPDAEAMVADWYAATDQIAPIFQDGLAAALALPAPEDLGEAIDEIDQEAETAFAAIAEMSAVQDPDFLFDDDNFVLAPLFDLFAEQGISDCG